MNYKFKTKPFEHQLDALEASCDKEVFAYFMEMGTGKSKVLLDNAAMSIKIGMTLKYLHIYQITLIKK
jgi:hypothetical protein